MLNNLGNLYEDTHRFAEAEAVFKEAVVIGRQLAAQNPAAYRPVLATTLNNMGVLYRAMQRFADAEAAFEEAVGIRRELAAQNPAADRPDLATTLNNLVPLHRGFDGLKFNGGLGGPRARPESQCCARRPRSA